MKRLKSPVLWTALAALALLCGHLLTGGSELTGQADSLYNILLTLVTALGIVNNPTDKTGL
jgi:uncharacterized membrane protein